METDVKDIDAHATNPGAVDWENRRLCSDENCIGVIGPDGRCKECGRPCDPGESLAGPSPAAHPAEAPAEEPPAAPAADPAVGADDDWENRRLCSDENCIGVIGADGRCRECGRPYAG
jgi:hypothetical protein